MSKFKKLVRQPLFLPIFCMILVMAVNIIYDVMAGNFAFNFFLALLFNKTSIDQYSSGLNFKMSLNFSAINLNATD